MSAYSNRLQPALQNLLQRVVRFFQPRSSCTTHIRWTFLADDNHSKSQWCGRKPAIISSCPVLPPEIVMHDDAYIARLSENNIKCMTISGGRTKQLNIFCHVTGFTSDFLSFIVVEYIQFFHGALQVIGGIRKAIQLKLFQCTRYVRLYTWTCPSRHNERECIALKHLMYGLHIWVTCWPAYCIWPCVIFVESWSYQCPNHLAVVQCYCVCMYVCILVFGSQPPISVAAPMPIHSRQQLPFANMAPPAVPPQVCRVIW